jgi:hypothetical protein
MTRRSGQTTDASRQVAAEEAELAKETTSNEARAQHYAMADYYMLRAKLLTGEYGIRSAMEDHKNGETANSRQ